MVSALVLEVAASGLSSSSFSFLVESCCQISKAAIHLGWNSPSSVDQVSSAEVVIEIVIPPGSERMVFVTATVAETRAWVSVAHKKSVTRRLMMTAAEEEEAGSTMMIRAKKSLDAPVPAGIRMVMLHWHRCSELTGPASGARNPPPSGWLRAPKAADRKWTKVFKLCVSANGAQTLPMIPKQPCVTVVARIRPRLMLNEPKGRTGGLQLVDKRSCRLRMVRWVALVHVSCETNVTNHVTLRQCVKQNAPTG